MHKSEPIFSYQEPDGLYIGIFGHPLQSDEYLVAHVSKLGENQKFSVRNAELFMPDSLKEAFLIARQCVALTTAGYGDNREDTRAEFDQELKECHVANNRKADLPTWAASASGKNIRIPVQRRLGSPTKLPIYGDLEECQGAAWALPTKRQLTGLPDSISMPRILDVDAPQAFGIISIDWVPHFYVGPLKHWENKLQEIGVSDIDI